MTTYSTDQDDNLNQYHQQLNITHLRCLSDFILLEQKAKEVKWRPSIQVLNALSKQNDEQTGYFSKISKTKNKMTKLWTAFRP